MNADIKQLCKDARALALNVGFLLITIEKRCNEGMEIQCKESIDWAKQLNDALGTLDGFQLATRDALTDAQWKAFLSRTGISAEDAQESIDRAKEKTKPIFYEQ